MSGIPTGPAGGVQAAAGGPAPDRGAGGGPGQSPPLPAQGRPQTAVIYVLHAVCIICRAESPVTSMRQLSSGSWLCLDAFACYQRFGVDREHDEYEDGA